MRKSISMSGFYIEQMKAHAEKMGVTESEMIRIALRNLWECEKKETTAGGSDSVKK